MDLISDLLRAVRLDGAHFYMVDATHPWSVRTAAALELSPRVLPASQHLISYHILVEGACWAGLAGDRLEPMHPGDVIVFPRGDAHAMASSEVEQGEPVAMTVAPPPYGEVTLSGNRNGPKTTFVCGFLGCDVRPYNPLLQSLPSCLRVSRGSGWLADFPSQVLSESKHGKAGAAAMLTRMAELMFIEVLRRHLVSLPRERRGWLAALRDPVVAPALTHLHQDPSRPWTLAGLARAVSASRTVLAVRFSQLVGVPPMQYLTRWRLQLAAEQLLRSPTRIATIGKGVGYGSESSFSRAFKRATGFAPAEWRKRQGAPVSPGGRVSKRRGFDPSRA